MQTHNVDPKAMHDRIAARAVAAPGAIHPLFPEEAIFVVRMIEYVSASTSTIQQVITLIENDPVAPSDGVQRAHALLTQLRGR